MTTFSQLVDELVVETKRPDLRVEIGTYLNQTLREVHFEPGRGNVVFYGENRREVELIASQETGEIWDIPNPSSFQGIETVRYPGLYLGGMDYAVEVLPGAQMASKPFYYYRSGPSFVFGGTRGYGGTGAKIQLTYFEYVASLKYKLPAARDAQYDVETGWTYGLGIEMTPTGQALARSRVTNWLLMRWADVLREGLRAKIYKRLSDQTRQTTSYSLYMQLRNGLYTSEIAQLSGA